MGGDAKRGEGRGGKKRKQRATQALTAQRKMQPNWRKMQPNTEEKKRRKTGPRLPSALLKELDLAEARARDSDDGSGSDVEERGDVYEYEEGIPQEDSGRNRRFDPVDNLEYELPDNFEDEDLPSDGELGSDAEGSQRSGGDVEDEDRHMRMLQGITGIPGQAFQGKKNRELVLPDVVDGGETQISIQDLLDPLHGISGYSSLRKKLQRMENKSMAVQAPLPRVERERLERKVAYDHSKKDMTKWEPLVKRNREAPTTYFEEDVDIGYSTVGAIASEFQPRTEFEKKMALLVRNPEIVEAHQKDGSRLLELNEDEDLPSDGELGSDAEGSERSGGDVEDEDRHMRMLQGITSIPGQAFQGKKNRELVLPDVVDGGETQISIQDLLDPLHGMSGYSSLRKKLQRMENKSMAVQAPLPRVERERLERKVAYDHSKKDMTKWEPLVKRNREAPTTYFEEDVDIGYSTVGAIASEFQPRTEFEKKMALLVRNPEIVEAHQKDGSRLLELNEISIEDLKDRQDRLAKMRSLLFRHEMKTKRIKKIKSKTYHRMMKKDRLKAASATAEFLMDPVAIKEQAMRQEFKRAEERMILKHKNSSKWAKRILKRGLNAQDEGTRAAITEQLHQHALLTRKMSSLKDSSSEDSSDDDEDDELPESGGVSKLLTSAKEKTLKVLEEEDEMPKSGVLSLPFMVRGLKKKNEALLEEGRVAVQEYDSSLRQIDRGSETGTPEFRESSGRKVFGASIKEPQENIEVESDTLGGSSDSEVDISMKRSALACHKESDSFQGAQISSKLPDEKEEGHKHVFKSFDDITQAAGPKTTYDVSMFVSDSLKKIEGNGMVHHSSSDHAAAPDHFLTHQDSVVPVHVSDMDSDEEMVDGFLSSGANIEYKLPSQAELVRRAFAGDNVEEEFEKQKMEMLNEEVPEPEKPVLLPGWGEWTHIQQNKGLPKWMVNEHEDAKRKREEALKKRKDAHLKHVIISEKIDKAQKLHTKTLPFPFTSKEVFEQSIRMPIGPEYNPAISVSVLNRPAVVKKPGIIIKPIQFEEVDPHEKPAEPRQSRQNPKKNKTTGKANKSSSKGKNV